MRKYFILFWLTFLLIFTAGLSNGADLIFSWGKNADGELVTKYRIYISTTQGDYSAAKTFTMRTLNPLVPGFTGPDQDEDPDPNSIQYTVTGFTGVGQHWAVCTAIDKFQIESAYSNEITFNLGGPNSPVIFWIKGVTP